MNIIHDLIELNENQFKNKLNEFIQFSYGKINGIKIINEICDKIKEKILLKYNTMIENQEINMNEYNILSEYEHKLDYAISIQNNIIKDLRNVNNELKLNMISFKEENNKGNVDISDQELNDNINITKNNIKTLENMLQNHINKNTLDNLDNINITNIKENNNFFDVLQNSYYPFKEINKEYEQILMDIFSQKKE